MQICELQYRRIMNWQLLMNGNMCCKCFYLDGVSSHVSNHQMYVTITAQSLREEIRERRREQEVSKTLHAYVHH